MPASGLGFTIDDTKPFDENLRNFAQVLTDLDPTLAPILQSYLTRLLDGTTTNVEIWNALLAVAARSEEAGS